MRVWNASQSRRLVYLAKVPYLKRYRRMCVIIVGVVGTRRLAELSCYNLWMNLDQFVGILGNLSRVLLHVLMHVRYNHTNTDTYGCDNLP